MGHARRMVAGLLLAVAASYCATPDGISAQSVETEALARIEQIIVNGRKKDNPTTSEVKVIRAATVVAATPALSLFADDELITSPNVGMSIIMLDAAAEQGNTVHIGPASQFRLRGKRSIFLILGRVLADVRGLFDVVTSRATLGAKGTEFEVRVTESDTQLLVLQGDVTVKEEPGARGVAAQEVLQVRRDPGPTFRRLPSLLASTVRNDAHGHFASAQAAQPPPLHHQRWLVEVSASTPVRTKQQLTVINRCQQTHLYDVEGPETLPWFNIFASERVEVRGGAARDVAVELQIDPSNVAASTYEGNAVIKCLDCFTEPGCAQSRELLPVVIKLARSTEVTVRPLEQITIGSAEVTAAPHKAQEERVRTTLNWTNEVILSGQPSYSARRVIPHYASPDERSRVFRESRFAAIWRREAGSYERLGEIYTDWGKGPKAVEAYTEESAVQPERTRSADFLADFAEANRLKGRLDESEQQLKSALTSEPGNAAVLNALGNVYMERAEIAIDTNDPKSGEGLTERARTMYERSLEGTAPASRRSDAEAVARANVGETHLQLGHLARLNKRLDVAQKQYATADAQFRTAHGLSEYAFSRVGWGDAFQGMGLVAQDRGEGDQAREAFKRADDQYKLGLRQHPDVPEAHIGVGDLLFREGRRKEALDSYLRAAAVRPDEPDAYYRVGVLLENQNPLLAARYLQTYLQLQPATLKRGETARRAARIVEGTRIAPGAIRVPNLVGLDDRAAREAIAKSGLTIGTLTPRPSAARQGSVIDQNPQAGTSAVPGSVVDIVVATTEGGGRPDRLLVPDVTGMPRTEAEQMLRAAGFTIGTIERKNSTRPTDTVIKQDPRGRSSERPGTAIDLEVAQREVKTVKVPNLVGDSRDHALKDIREERLQIGTIREQPGCEPGRVLAQDPQKDTKVPEGSTVSLTVAVPGSLVVPQLRGVAQQHAESVLRERGLRIGKIKRTETDRESPGTVMSQDPRPDAPAAPGCPVDFEVAVPIPLVTVPSFIGLTEEQARQRLPRGFAGAFSPLRLGNVTYREYSEVYGTRMGRTQAPPTVPTVIEQSPVANSQVRKGTEVNLVVLRPPAPVIIRPPEF